MSFLIESFDKFCFELIFEKKKYISECALPENGDSTEFEEFLIRHCLDLMQHLYFNIQTVTPETHIKDHLRMIARTHLASFWEYIHEQYDI